MIVKSYYSPSVEAALAQARQELGPDAMLMNSKRAAADYRHLGEYEVVFAVPPGESGFGQEFARAAGDKRAGAPVDRLTQEVADLRRQLERTTSMFHRVTALAAGPMSTSQGHMQALSRLLSNEVDADLAQELLSRVQAPQGASAEEVEAALREEIGRTFLSDSSLGKGGSGPMIVAVVGPPGVGKTTTLVKLAIRYGVATRKAVQFLSMDTDRIGGTELLRCYATVIGANLDVVAPAGLSAAIDRARYKDLILIDTPGFDRNHSDHRCEVARALRSRNDVDVHLVLPATMRTPDLNRLAAEYAMFTPGKLIFTRLDETAAAGTVLNQCAGLEKPVSYLCAGQKVPEDIKAAEASLIAELLLPRSGAAAAVAA